MDKEIATRTIVREEAAMIANNRTDGAAHRRVPKRIPRNLLLVWLDANIDEAEKDYKESLEALRHIETIEPFTDSEQCVNFLNELKEEKVLMIVAGYI
ncbi:unnamed protein product, partial [Rotaria sordida]